MPLKRLLRLKHGRTELGFISASLSLEDMDRAPLWALRLEAPSSTDSFRRHLKGGSSMTLRMTTRDGQHLRGEAYVSSISEAADAATVVVLAGHGPLQCD